MNNNITTNSIEFFNLLKSQWQWAHGPILVTLVEWSLLYSFVNIESENSEIIKVGIDIGLVVINFFWWVISTDRWFHRTRYWVLLWILLVLGCGGLYAYWIYPSYIESTEYGSELIRWVGAGFTSTICFLLYYFVDFYLWKRKKLYIVFLVSDSSKNEDRILSMLNAARREIEEATSDIRIIIPPFGIVEGIKKCERFINGWFCQADAIIYAKILESDDEFGYKFTDFTSRMNNHRLPKKREEGVDVNIILSEASKTKDWNTLNSKDNSIATKEFMAENLVQLLLIYVGCIYLYKSQYTEAIPVVKKLYARGLHEDSDIYNITANLLANAYLTAEQWEEQEKKDYDLAFNTLVECKSLLPSISYSLKYQLAMARVYMLKGDIKESKRYTKSINPPSRKDANGHIIRSNVYDWYIYINMAYYAIYERKPLEITTNYKKLFTSPAPDIEELEFAINFLKNDLKSTIDNQFKMMLCHGLAFLHLYLDQKLSLKYLKDAEKYRNERGYNMLSGLRDMITNPIRKLVVRK